MSNPALNIALIGCGRMGAAIAIGLLDALPACEVHASDPSTAARDELAARAQARDTASRLQLAGHPPITLDGLDAIIVAVKPHLVEGVLRALPEAPERLVISVAAGIECTALRAATHHRVVRVMPNTPALVGRATTGILADHATRDDDIALTQQLFDAIGTTVLVHDEALMHVVTGLAGSGPAYAAMIVEALADGAVAEGLPRATAYALARSMIAGTMALLEERHPGELKDGVCSPGGTTIEAVAVLEARGLRAALIEAVRASSRRSRELARGE